MKKKLLNQLISVSLSAAMLAGSVYTVPAADFTSEEIVTQSDDGEAFGDPTEGSTESSVNSGETEDEVIIEDENDFSDDSSEENSELEITLDNEDDSADTEAEMILEEDTEFDDSTSGEEAAFDANASLKEGRCGKNLTWRISADHILYIDGTGDMDDGGDNSILKSPWQMYAGNSLYYFNEAVISEGVTSIGNYAFYGTGISSVNIPSTVKRIGKYAFTGVKFEGTSALKLNSNIKEIGEHAFSGSGLTSLNLKDLHLDKVPDGLVINCEKLMSFTFPSGVKEIGEYAFADCSSLSVMNIPDGITYIGGAAFENCTGLTNVYIPSTVSYMDYIKERHEQLHGVFTGCSNLKTAGNGATYNINFGWRSGESLPTYAFMCADKLESVVLPEGMTGVEELENKREYGAFRDCVNLTSVSIPESFTNFGYGLFYGCKSLGQIQIPSGVKELNGTFIGCKLLTEVAIPEGVTNLAATFANCSSLTKVNIPDTVVSFMGIGHNFWQFGAFENCSELKKLTVPGTVEYIDSSDFKGTPMDSVGPIGSGMALEYGWTEKIPAHAFRAMKIQEVRFPDTITEIGEGAFSQCAELKRIALPEGLTEISTYLLSECKNLTTVKLPEKLTQIDYRAFEECPSLKNIRFRGDAFVSCYDAFVGDELTAWYPADNKTWKKSKRQNYGGQITWKKYKNGKPVDNEKTRTVTINGGGQATARFFFCDDDGNAVPEENFTYERRAGNQNGQVHRYNKAEIMTDIDGGYEFTTPYYTYSSDESKNTDDVEYIAEWTDDAGKKHKEEFTVHVKVVPMVYSETWTAGLGSTVSSGAKEWKWFEYGHDSESNITLKHKADGTEDLVLGITLSYAAKAKLERDGKWGTDKNSNIRVLKASGSDKATSYSSYSTTLANFDIHNTNHQKLLASYLELMMLIKADITGVNSVLEMIFGKSLISGAMKNFEISEQGIKVSVSGSSSVLNLKTDSLGDIFDVKLGGLNGSTTYSAAQNWDENGNESFSAGVKSSSQFALVSTGTLSLIGDAGLWGYHNVNSSSLSVNDNDDVTLSESKYSSGFEEEVGYDEVISSSSMTIKNASELIKSDQALYALDRGQNYPITSGEIAKAVKAIKDSKDGYTYSIKDNLTNSYEFSPSIQVFKTKADELASQAGKDVTPLLNAGFSLHYTHGWSTETSNGAVKDHTVLQNVDSSSTIERAKNDADNHNIAEVMLFAAKGVSEQFKDLLHLGTSSIGNILKLGSASISSKALTGKNWMVNLLSRKKESAQDIAESYAVYTAASEAEAVQIGEGNTEAAETANTVGDVFIVSVTDEDKNEEVADFSGADLKITLSYTEEELQNAGATLADVSDLAIYRLDKENNVYVYVDSEVDENAQQVTAPVDKAGEYILIYDGAAPSVTDINVVGRTTENPVITANITDISGVSSVTVDLDGEALVTEADFADYYDKSTGEFSYKMDTALSKGDHTISFTAVDGKGKAGDSVEYPFNVGDAPKFKEIFVPKYTLDGESTTIRAKVETDTDEKYIVSAKVWVGRYSQSQENIICNMTETEDGCWEGTFAPQDVNDEFNVQLTVSNGNGDETQSEVYINKFAEGDESLTYDFGDIKYEFNPVTGTIDYISTEKTEVEIPAQIEGKPVQKLECNFYGIKTLTIPECITEIDSYCDDDLVVRGYTNSQAEFWAKTQNLTFESLGTGNAGYSGTFGRVSWNFKDSVLTLAGDGEMYSKWEADDYPWYELRNDITKVVIKEGITNIGYAAFDADYFKKLKEVEIAKSVTEIEYGNFMACDTIYGYYGSEAEKYASNHDIAFKALEALSGKFGDNDEFTWKYESNTLTISGTGNLPDYTKGDKKRPWSDSVSAWNIQKVVFEEGIKGIGAYMFESVDSIGEISFPNTLESIGDYAFIECRRLNSCIIPDSVTSIGKYAIGYNYAYGSEEPEKKQSFLLRGDSETAKKYAEENNMKILGADAKVDISDCHIKIDDTDYKDGEEVIPFYDVYSSDWRVLIENVDFVVRFENNKNVGTARAIFTGIGLYTGSKTVTFEICAPDDGDDDDNHGGISHEHVYGGWKLTKAPTVFEKGIQTRTCRICGATDSIYIDKADPTGRLNMSSIPLKVKQSTSVVKASGLAAGDYIKSYRTANSKIATVNAKGKIKAKKKGNTKLYVKLASGKVLSATIKVQKTAVKTRKVSVNKKKITLKCKKSFQLKTTITPLTSLQKVTYASSNKKVVTVSKSGKLVAKKAGKAKITIKSGSKKITVKVTVKK